MEDKLSAIAQAIETEKDPQFLIRLRAVKALLSGKDMRTVALDTGKSADTIFRWQRLFEKSGVEGLKPGLPGRQRQWTPEQIRKISALLKEITKDDLYTLRDVEAAAERVLGKGFFTSRPRNVLSKLIVALGMRQAYVFCDRLRGRSMGR